MSMTTAPPGGAALTLQQYQAQLQANQAALGQQLLISPQRQNQQQQQQQQHLNPVSIATQQQQQLMNKAMEKQSELELDKKRVTLLLEINAELLRQVMLIQPQLKSPEEAKNDPIFRECMRRLQQNLAYLAAIADRSHKPASLIPVCPGVLLPPPDMPALQGLYKRLQELYPGINPANPPQQHQQSGQLGPHRSGQNSSPKPQIPQGASNSMPPPNHGSPPPRDSNHMTSPPPQMPSHQSPPPSVMQGMQLQPHQQPPPPPTPQQQPQQMMYANHGHPQSPMQDPRMHQQQQQQQQQQQHYAQLQQQQQQQAQQRQIMLQRAQQQAQQQALQQQGHMVGQMGIPTSMGMGVNGPAMNGMSTSMAPQQTMNPGMMAGAAPGMVMAGGMVGMHGYGGGMAHMSTAGPMVGGMGAMVPMNGMGPVGQMGHMGMTNMPMGMGGMPPAGYADINQSGMWNPGWNGGT